MIRVLHLVPRFIRGGVARVIEDLMTGVDSSRFETFLACDGADDVNRDHVIHGLPLYPTTAANTLRGFFAVRRLVKNLEIDILHSHHRFTSVVGRLVSISTGRRFTSTVHDLATGGPRMTRMGFGSVVTVFSDAVEKHLIDTFRVSSSRIRRVPMGIPTPARPTAAERSAIRRSLDTEETAPVVVYAGRLDWEKGPDLLLAAVPRILSRIPGTVFWIAGSGELEAQLREQARAAGVEDHVRFAGWRDDVFAIVGSGDVAVVPSRREGFGRSAIEAMALQMPVIAATTGGISGVIEDHETGILVPPDDPAAIATSAVRLLTDRSFADAIAAHAYQRTRGRYTAAAMVEAFQHLYEELAAA